MIAIPTESGIQVLNQQCRDVVAPVQGISSCMNIGVRLINVQTIKVPIDIRFLCSTHTALITPQEKDGRPIGLGPTTDSVKLPSSIYIATNSMKCSSKYKDNTVITEIRTSDIGVGGTLFDIFMFLDFSINVR